METGQMILVVDDDPGVRGLLRDLFDGEGYRVAVAVDGVAALEYLDCNPVPDLLFLDLMMPRLDGEGVLAAMSVRGIAVPVIVASARPQAAVIKAAAQARGYLTKPFDIERLLEMVTSIFSVSDSPAIP